MMSLGLIALVGLHTVSQAAAGALLTAVWQGALLAAAAGLGLRLASKAPAALRFAIWFAVFAVVAALPLVELWPHGAAAVQPAGHDAWLMIDERWSLAIAAVWVVASLARAVTLAVAGFRLRTLWRRATAVAIDMPEGSRSAQVCVSDEVDRPSVIGFFAPKILIPTWLLERLTPVELEQIVLHEAGHLGRADDWLNLVQKVALVVFPLNPALAWVERRLCFERELACDERVLRACAGTQDAAKAYATCLVSLAEHRTGRRARSLGLALGLGGARESELGQRVGRILRFREWMRPVHARMVMSVAIIGLLGGVAGLDRCPQVVGFSAFHASGLQLAAAVPPVDVASGVASYRDVVFRPDVNRTMASERELVARVPVVDITARGPKIVPFMRVETPTPRPARISRVKFSAIRARTVSSQPNQQWLVVTSWSGMDGSRMVLTAMTVPAEVTTRISESEAPSEAAASPAQDAPQQVYRYAAVPVRGGWLVIQL